MSKRHKSRRRRTRVRPNDAEISGSDLGLHLELDIKFEPEDNMNDCSTDHDDGGVGDNAIATTTSASAANTTQSNSSLHKRKHEQQHEDIDTASLTDDEREAKIVQTLHRLKVLIDERKPGMMANYNAECERVQQERKKIQIALAVEGVPVECTKRRRPKRRFPWCPRSRTLLGQLVKLAKTKYEAATILAKRALPLFPKGFVRMPTLLRQADLSKEIKVSEVKRQRTGNRRR